MPPLCSVIVVSDDMITYYSNPQSNIICRDIKEKAKFNKVVTKCDISLYKIFARPLRVHSTYHNMHL